MSSKDKKVETPPEALAFIDLILGAMEDAAVDRKLTQLKAQIMPRKTGRMAHVRIIVVPETMDLEQAQPFKKGTCPNCKGTGSYDGSACLRCGATGKVIQ